jgi:hypothetical protein
VTARRSCSISNDRSTPWPASIDMPTFVNDLMSQCITQRELRNDSGRIDTSVVIDLSGHS